MAESLPPSSSTAPPLTRLLFTCVCSGQTILAKHAECVGNFTEIAQELLKRVTSDRDQEGSSAGEGTFGKFSLSSGGYRFHILRENRLQHDDGGKPVIVMAIADDGFPQGAAFQCITRIQTQFVRQFPLSSSSSSSSSSLSVPLSLHSELGPLLANEMKLASKAGQEDKIQRIQGEVDQVRDIMVQNIESIVERGERLDLIIDKTESLASESTTFRQAGRRLERRMWWQNTRMKVFMGLGLVVIVYAIVSFSCGGPLWPKCV